VATIGDAIVCAVPASQRFQVVTEAILLKKLWERT